MHRDRSRGCFGRKPVPTPVLASCLFPKHIAVHDVHLKKVSALPHFSKSFDAAATSGITASDSANNARKLDAPELRYRILERLGEGFFCVPDAFPVGLSSALARKRGLETFPEIKKDQETFRAIAQHPGLKETATLSDEERLLVYKEFKKLRGAVHLERLNDQFRFKTGLKEQTGDISVEGLIIRNGTIKILKREITFLTCPVCLAAGTRIETPYGSVLVQNVKPGGRVWTLDARGHKISTPVLKTPQSQFRCIIGWFT